MPSDSDQTTEQTKARIYTEQVKQRHVTHWDLDYLPREALQPRCPSLQLVAQ